MFRFQGQTFCFIRSNIHYVSLLTSRAESSVCIFAGVTELLVMAEERSSVFSTIDPVFTHVKHQIASFCSSRPSIQVMLSPPLYQARPAWYRESLPWIANQFSSRLGADRPQTVHFLIKSNLREKKFSPAAIRTWDLQIHSPALIH